MTEEPVGVVVFRVMMWVGVLKNRKQRAWSNMLHLPVLPWRVKNEFIMLHPWKKALFQVTPFPTKFMSSCFAASITALKSVCTYLPLKLCHEIFISYKKRLRPKEKVVMYPTNIWVYLVTYGYVLMNIADWKKNKEFEKHYF